VAVRRALRWRAGAAAVVGVGNAEQPGSGGAWRDTPWIAKKGEKGERVRRADQNWRQFAGTQNVSRDQGFCPGK